MNRLTVRVCLCVIGLLSVSLLGGCAYNHVDKNGNQRVVGFVNMTIVQPKVSQDMSGPMANTTFAGRVADIQTFGLGIGAEQGVLNRLSLGYSRFVTGHVRDNALVLGNPKAIRQLFEPSRCEIVCQGISQ